jgi:hypothetical protein
MTPTQLQQVYISLCTSGSADNNGELIIYAYADSVPNSFGNSPVNVDTTLTIDFRISGATTPYQEPIITITTGTDGNNITVTDFAPNEAILSLEFLNFSPTSTTTQVYLNGGTTTSATCNVVP